MIESMCITVVQYLIFIASGFALMIFEEDCLKEVTIHGKKIGHVNYII